MLEALLPGQPEAVARLRATFAGLYSLDMVYKQPIFSYQRPGAQSVGEGGAGIMVDFVI